MVSGACPHRSSVAPARSELAVPGVAEARDDVALLVELPVERRAVDLDVGVGRVHRRDAFRRGDQVHQLDADRLHGAPALEHVDRGRRASRRSPASGRGSGTGRPSPSRAACCSTRPGAASARRGTGRGARPGPSASARASRRPCRGRPAGSGSRPIRSPSSLAVHLLHRRLDRERARRGVGQRLVAEQPATARGRPRGTSSARCRRRAGRPACAGRRDGSRRAACRRSSRADGSAPRIGRPAGNRTGRRANAAGPFAAIGSLSCRPASPRRCPSRRRRPSCRRRRCSARAASARSVR